jgi:hypothetical protein
LYLKHTGLHQLALQAGNVIDCRGFPTRSDQVLGDFFAVTFVLDFVFGLLSASALLSAMATAYFCAFLAFAGSLLPMVPLSSYSCMSVLMLLLIVFWLDPFLSGMIILSYKVTGKHKYWCSVWAICG